MTTGHSVEELAVLVTIKSPVGVEMKELFLYGKMCAVHACLQKNSTAQ